MHRVPNQANPLNDHAKGSHDWHFWHDSKSSNLKIFQKRPNASKRFRTRQNASQWVRMDPNGSEHVRKPRKARENFKKSREIFEKLRENFRKNFFHGAVITTGG